MCYVVRQQQAGSETSAAAQPGGRDRIQPRWVGALAAVLVAGLAVAALLAPASVNPVPAVEALGAPAPVATMNPALPATPVVDQAVSGLDDGVPSAPDTFKAGSGACPHAL
jgi:hypothetical protein